MRAWRGPNGRLREIIGACIPEIAKQMARLPIILLIRKTEAIVYLTYRPNWGLPAPLSRRCAKATGRPRLYYWPQFSPEPPARIALWAKKRTAPATRRSLTTGVYPAGAPSALKLS